MLQLKHRTLSYEWGMSYYEAKETFICRSQKAEVFFFQSVFY